MVFFNPILLDKLSFIKFEVSLLESGAIYKVEAPENMRTYEFTDIFIREVSSRSPSKSNLSRSHMYANFLLVGRGDEIYQEVDATRTLKENNVRMGSICRIGGRILGEYRDITYSPSVFYEQHGGLFHKIRRSISKASSIANQRKKY